MTLLVPCSTTLLLAVQHVWLAYEYAWQLLKSSCGPSCHDAMQYANENKIWAAV